MDEQKGRGRMLLISGPSGSGKSSICRRLLEDPRVVFSVSATTRAPRPGETDGREYRFVTREEFKAMQQRGEFIESAEVHGNLYGTLRAPMEAALAEGQVFLVEIDVQGALQLKELDQPGVYVFIDVPDIDELRRRLEARGTDAPDVIARRVAKAETERMEKQRYDHVIVNTDLEAAIRQVRVLAGLERASAAGGRP
jgi:guanylate kinase